MKFAVNNRVPQLDLLRGAAVLMVIVHHYPYFHFLYRITWVGVDLFFVLSGFLISGLLFNDWKKHGKLSIGRFFIRRGFKIYPAFYIFLLATLPIMFFIPEYRGQLLPRFASEMFFLQDYIGPLWPHTWSLAVEEQFYILLPILLLVLSRIRRSSPQRGFALIPVISISLLIACLALRLRAQMQDPLQDPMELIAPFHFRADSLFLGVALGYWFNFHGESFRAFSRWWLLPASLALLVPLVIFGRQVQALPFVLTCNTVAFALLLCWILPRERIRLPLIERIGFYSYSIYLWHAAITLLLRRALPFNLLMFCVNIVVCCVVGAYMARAVERRVLALRDRLFPADGLNLASPERAAAGSPVIVAADGVPAG